MVDTPSSHRRRTRRLERSTLLAAIAPLAVDLGSTLAFYALFALTADPRIAAAGGMALAIGQLLLAKLRHRPIATLQLASIALVLIIGGITLWTDDPRFVLVKATVVYAILGGSMLRPGWMARYIPPIAASHVPAGLLSGFERAWAALLLGTGALNVAVLLWAGPARAAQVMGAWVIASKLALFAVQYIWCRAVARPSIKAQLQQDADGASGG